MSADFELTDSLIEDLLHVIANLMHKKCSSLFHEPVDYVGLKLNDYLDVIKRPMDLTTLRTNLREREYAHFSDFLKDVHLIFENCRVYNGHIQDGYYFKQANECEELFVGLVSRLPNLNFTQSIYNELIYGQKGTPGVSQSQFSIYKLQQLITNMNQLNPQDLTECMEWYCRVKQTTFELNNLHITFNTQDVDVLSKLDQMVSEYLPKRSRRVKQ